MEISPKRLVIALFIVFMLGVMFAIVNGIYTEDYGTTLPLITYAISFVSLVAGGFVVILFQWKINKVQLTKILKILPSDERVIVKILLENNNSIEQNKLVAFSGFNKVKVSRLIKELILRGVVKKTNLGNTNLIVLDL